MIIWSTFFIEFWKRRQITVAMQWGVHGFEAEETDRPEFQGIVTTSPVNGKNMTYFPDEEKNYRTHSLTHLLTYLLTYLLTHSFTYSFR